jgi:hypothetical protein
MYFIAEVRKTVSHKGSFDMYKKVLLFSAVIGSVIFFLCTTPQSPFNNPANAKIYLFLENSRNQLGAAAAVSDTVGNSIKIGVCPYLYNFFDSVQVSMLHFENGNDTIVSIRSFSSDADTQWFSFSFTSAKVCTVSVKGFIQGDMEREVSGVITIYGKPVSAAVHPLADTAVVDSSATFSVAATGDGPFTYQWSHGTMQVIGKTNDTLSISHLAFADSGVYTCLVKDKWGDSAIVGPASLIVLPKPVVKTNTKPKLVISGPRNILSSEICTLTVSVTDPDSGQTDLVTLVKGPAGNTFSNNKMIWKPAAGFLGVDTAVFAAVDNGAPPLSDTQKVAIVVSATILLPDSVKGIVAVSRFAGSFVFKWNKVANSDAYIVFRSKDTTGFVQYLTVSDTTFTNNIKDTAFYYYVVATNSKGQSVPSSVVHSTAINAAPKWSHDTISVTVNQGVLVSINCADSCKDTNGDAVTFSLAAGGPATDSLVGTTWKYTPTLTDSGLSTTKIKAWDGMDSSVAVLVVHVMTVLHAPSGLTYSLNPATYWTNAAITPNVPTVTGTVDSFSVSPALPLGLAFNKTTGIISGTPTAVTGLATYTITAKNQAGTTTASVSITVNGPSTGFTYSSNPAAYWVGVTITPDSAKVTGTVDSFSVSPGLPAGLAINKLTGVINGTPTAVSVAAAYTITAKNQAGATTASLSIAVNGKPTAFAYSANPATFWTNVAITPDSARVTGAVDSFTVSPALPAPLTLDKSTGIITGTPTAASTGTYVVTAKNQAGSATASLSITVNGPPTAFTYSSNPATFWTNVAITPDSARVTGVVDSFTVSPALPAGLTLAKATGIITGSPTAAAPSAAYVVTAKNQAGTANGSLTITVIGPPSKPVLSLPADDSVNISLNDTLIWRKNSESNVTYRIQISKSRSFANNYFDSASGLADTFRPAIGLQPNTIYYWRVCAVDSGGPSAWASDSFITALQWTAANNGLSNFVIMGFAANNTNLFEINSGGGVYRFNTSGGSWDSIGLVPDANVLSFAVNGNILFAGTSDKGIFRSPDGGATWSSVNGLTDTNITSIAASGNDVCAGTPDSGVYVSVDNGLNWNKKPGTALQLDSMSINGVAMNSSYMFASGSTFNGIYFSTNLGQWWTNSGPAYLLGALYANNGNLYAGTNGNGSFLSKDNGSTWTPLNSPTRVYGFVSNGNYLFYGSRSSLLFSANGGNSFSTAGFGYSFVGIRMARQLAVIANSVFAVCAPNGVFQTTLPTSLP